MTKEVVKRTSKREREMELELESRIRAGTTGYDSAKSKLR